MKRSILLFGSASDQRNVGDFAMLTASLGRMRRWFPEHTTVIWAESVKAVPPRLGYEVRQFPNVLGSQARPGSRPGVWGRFISRLVLIALLIDLLVSAFLTRLSRRAIGLRRSTREVTGTLKDVDVVVTYGSGALNDLWLKQNVLRWSLVYFCAYIIGCPVALTGQGIGPLRNRFARFILGRALNTTRMITVRDASGSIELLREIGVSRPRVIFTGDDALDQESVPGSRLEQILDQERIARNGIGIAVHVRPTDYQNSLDDLFPKIAETLDQLIASTGANVVFVPLSNKTSIDDRAACRAVLERMSRGSDARVLEGEYSPAELKAVIGTQQVALGISYHFALFALASGVPTVSVFTNGYYRQKAIGLAASFGPGTAPVGLRESSPESLAQAVKSLLTNRDEYRESLLSRTAQMRARTREAGHLLMSMVGPESTSPRVRQSEDLV